MAKNDKIEIRVTNPSPKLKQELENIADNLGVTLSPFLKIKLRDIADSYPDEMKKPKSRD